MLDFLGIGAQKAGTTWIYENLRHHPEITFPHGKEIHFWDAQRDRGVEWYKSLFAANMGKKQGEITPAYAFLDVTTIREMYALNPNMRVIFSARDPIDRAWSSARMAVKRAEMEIEEASDQWFIDHFYSQGSLNRGDYLRCLSNWLEVFPEGQLLVLRYEDIASNPSKVLEACCKHLGVDPGFFAKHSHITKQKEKIYQGVTAHLRPSLLTVLQEIYGKKILAFDKVMRQWQEEGGLSQRGFIILSDSEQEAIQLRESLASHPCIRMVGELHNPANRQLVSIGSHHPLVGALGGDCVVGEVADQEALRSFIKTQSLHVIYLSKRENDQTNILSGLSVPVLSLDYSQCIETPDKAFASIFSFLGVAPYPLVRLPEPVITNTLLVEA